MPNQFLKILENKQVFKQVIDQSAKQVQSNEYEAKVYSKLLENTRQSLLESSGTLAMTDIEPVARVIFPLIKKLFPRLIANKIVSVQPLTGPTGFVRFLHYYYNTTEVPANPSYAAPAIPYSQPIPNTLNDSYPQISSETIGTGNGTTTAFAYTTQINPVAHNTIQIKVGGTTVATDGTNADASANTGTIMGSYNGSPVYGTINYLTGAIQLTIVSPVPASTAITVQYSMDFVSATENQISSANFVIDNVPLFANIRKLRASWMPGALNALQSIDGIDLEKTLFTQVSNIIATEINQEVIADLIAQTPSDAVHNFWTEPPTSPIFYGTRTEWYAQLIVKINQVAAVIANKIMIGEPNYIVVNPATAALLRSAFVDFKMSDAGVNDFATLSYVDYGNLNGRYEVFASPVMPPDIVFLGYKGPEAVDSGYVYAPWIPLKGQRYATDTGETGIVFYTGYGKKMYRNDFYGYVVINHGNPPANWSLDL